MKSQIKKTIAILLLVCFVVSLTATAVSARIIKPYCSENNCKHKDKAFDSNKLDSDKDWLNRKTEKAATESIETKSSGPIVVES